MKVTLLKPSANQKPTKVFQEINGELDITSCQPVKYWNFKSFEFDDIRHFAQALGTTLASSRVIIILGTAVDDLPSEGVLRNSQNFPDQGTPLISIDIDRFSLPIRMDPFSLAAVLWFIKKHLPPCFHGVTCAVQFSASAGIVDPSTGKPIKPGLNVHLSCR